MSENRFLWLGWRNDYVQAAVQTRAVDLAVFSGDPATADRFLDKIEEIIATLERLPESGSPCPKAPGYRYCVIGQPAPGSPDVLVYSLDVERGTLLGEGVFPFVPPRYR